MSHPSNLAPKPLSPPDANGYFRYASGAGMWFAYDAKTNKCSDIMHCRDSFRYYWEGFRHEVVKFVEVPFGGKEVGEIPSAYVGFSWLTQLTAARLIEFAVRWDSLETHLNLTNRSIIHPTNVESVMIVQLSDFWMANDTVRSFATLFIRMLMCYPAATFEESVNLYPLAHAINLAIERFMLGFTHPTYAMMTTKTPGDSYVGICNEMRGLSAAAIAAKLIKPPGAAPANKS